MHRRVNRISKREMVSRANERRIVVRFARDASSNAKRTSKALDISYDIIKNGSLYKVLDNNMIKVADIIKTPSNRSGLIKGSTICLK